MVEWVEAWHLRLGRRNLVAGGSASALPHELRFASSQATTNSLSSLSSCEVSLTRPLRVGLNLQKPPPCVASRRRQLCCRPPSRMPLSSPSQSHHPALAPLSPSSSTVCPPQVGCKQSIMLMGLQMPPRPFFHLTSTTFNGRIHSVTKEYGRYHVMRPPINYAEQYGRISQSKSSPPRKHAGRATSASWATSLNLSGMDRRLRASTISENSFHPYSPNGRSSVSTLPNLQMVGVSTGEISHKS